MPKNTNQLPKSQEDSATANEQANLTMVARVARQMEELNAERVESNLVVWQERRHLGRVWSDGTITLTLGWLTPEQVTAIMHIIEGSK